MRKLVVDTLAAIVFFTTVAALTELFIAGMEPSQVLVARLIMIPVMVLTGRPYGIWRDWVFRTFKPQTKMAAIGCDVIAFLAFQLPVYMATLALAGASRTEIITAASAALLLMVLLSWPYGLFLELVREKAGVSTR